MQFAKAITISLLATTLVGCQYFNKLAEQERQKNLQACMTICGHTFPEHAAGYERCMNAGQNSYGDFSMTSCQSYTQPFNACMDYGFIYGTRAFSTCVMNESHDIKREQQRQANMNKTHYTSQICERHNGVRICHTKSN